MDERVIKFRVGVMVISTLFIAGILILLFGDTPSLVHTTYTVYMHFSDAPGVTSGTPIRKSGILIGRVKNVRFADQGGVVVTGEIYGNVKLYRSEVPQVSGSLLGGDVVIQFIRRTNVPPPPKPATPGVVPATSDAGSASPQGTRTADQEGPSEPAQAAALPPAPAENPNDMIRDGEYIEGSVAQNPLQAIGNMEADLSGAIGSMSNASDQVGKLAASVNKLLESNDEQITRIVNKSEQTLDSLQHALKNFEDVFGDPETRENLRKAISGLPDLLTDTREAMGTVRTTVESVDRNLRNLEGFTGPLGDRGEQMVDRIDKAIADLDVLLGEMSDFGRKLNAGEGSLGRIMRDPDLYQNLNAAAQNLAQITCQIKPILADARVFSDKIARHPELLGVRGAISKSPGTK
jgi:phospholipid/cholesterol/gamma-HCH transport system substrate-binding protein